MTSSRSPALQTITTVLTKRTKPSLPDCRAKLKVRASASRPWRVQVTGWSAAHERRATSNDGTSAPQNLRTCVEVTHRMAHFSSRGSAPHPAGARAPDPAFNG